MLFIYDVMLITVTMMDELNILQSVSFIFRTFILALGWTQKSCSDLVNVEFLFK